MAQFIIPLTTPDPISLLGPRLGPGAAPDAMNGAGGFHVPAPLAPEAPASQTQDVDVCSRLFALCKEWQPRLDTHRCECLFNVSGGRLPSETYDVLSWCIDELMVNLTHAWKHMRGPKTLLVQLDRKGSHGLLLIAAKYTGRLAPADLDCETPARMAASIGAGFHAKFFGNGVAFAVTFTTVSPALH